MAKRMAKADFDHDRSAAYLNARIVRAYRMLVTVYVEGDADTVPDMLEIAEHTATQVQDEYDHDLAVCVRPIETEDYSEIPKTTATQHT